MDVFVFLDWGNRIYHTGFVEGKRLKRQNSIRAFFGRFNPGITLIELLISVAIVGLLAILVVMSFRGQIFKGNDARRKADVNRIQIAAEEYEKDHDCYPETIICGYEVQDISPYLKNVPCDPVTNQSYHYEPDPDNLNCPSWYRIYSSLENQNDSDYFGGIGVGGAYSYYASSPNAPDPVAEGPGSTSTPMSGFWGCKSGVCTPLSSFGECSPNYTTSQCGNGCSSSPECDPEEGPPPANPF